MQSVHTHVGAGDRAALLACFEETSALAFSVLCQLSAGDTRLALDLLIDTYRYIGRTAATPHGIDVDQTWIVDAACSIYAARAPRPGPSGIEPVASLSTRERVVVHLRDVEGRPRPRIATLLGTTETAIEGLLSSGRACWPGAVTAAAVAETFRRGDVWFDDVMRAEARARLGGRSPSGSPSEDTPRATDDRSTGLLSRRTMIRASATASIAALAGIGVWLGSGNEGKPRGADLPDGPQARSTTTTTHETTPFRADTRVPGSRIVVNSTTGEVAVVTSGARVIPPTGFIVDPLPAGLLPAGGYVDNDAETPNWMQVWASPDADHMSGRWLALVAMDSTRSTQTVATDARRVVIGGHSGVLRLRSSGAARVTVAVSDTVQVEAQTFGFTAAMLDVLFAGMTVDGDHQPAFVAADTALDGLDLVVSRPSREASVAYDVISGDRSALYTSADGNRYVSIVAGAQRAGDLFATRLLSEPSIIQTTIAYSSDRTIRVGGRGMLIGVLDELGADLFIQWHDGGHTVTASGNVELSRLFEMAANTRLATVDEWSAQRTATVPEPDQPPDRRDGVFFGTGNLVQIGQATTSSYSEWTISISGDGVDDSGRLGLLIEHGFPGTNTPARRSMFNYVVPDAAHSISEFVAASATILVGVFDTPGAARAMRVTVEGKAPEDVPLVRLGETELYGAAYAFSTIAGYGVVLVDASGAVVRDIAT